MRIPVSWLAEYADLPAGTTPEALVQQARGTASPPPGAGPA